jgi:DNA-binding NarL/FixJ family response regulator
MSEDKIKVFLIDDEPLAIEGWKDLLIKDGHFQIVGKTSPEKMKKSTGALPHFDIVLAGAGLLMLSTKKRTISALKKAGLNVKIVIIVDNKEDIQRAQRAGVDEAIQSPFQRTALTNLLRGLNQEPKKRCAYYVQQLGNLHANEKSNRDYEYLISDILQFLFSDHLIDRYLRFKTSYGNRECSLLFSNRSNHPFWEMLRVDHNGTRVLFDIRNARSVKPDNIGRLGRRLSKEVGGVGIIVSHLSASNSIQGLQVALYKNESKVVFSITNLQIKNMLIQKAAGIDPTEIFQDIYQEFMAEL